MRWKNLSELEPSEDLEDLYENAPCGYLSMRPDGRIAKVNRTLCGWLGKQPDEIVGKRFRDLLNVAGRIFYETHFAPLLRMQGFFDEVALDLLTSDGSTIATIANGGEKRDDSGEVVFTRLTIFRATERRRYERELVDAQSVERDARQQLQESNATLTADVAEQVGKLVIEQRNAELREQFIAVLGHDLRNPLAAINAGRRMIEKEHQDPKTIRVLRLMGESVTRMSGLIDNLMDFARGRLGGGIGVDVVRGQRIEPTLSQVVNEIRSGHPDREIELRFDVSEPVDVDHARIAQMFSNLLGNAITHGSKDRPIVVDASIVDGVFKLSIANGGEPIPAETMERLFQPFYRGEVQPSSQGLGLGLYIASQIAEAHSGKLEVHSNESETKFVFRVPVQRR